MKLAISLREYRRNHRLTQKEVAAALGVSREYYGRIEAGKGTPSMKLLEKICLSTDIGSETVFGKRAAEISHNQLMEMCKLCVKLRSRDRRTIHWLIRRFAKR